MTDWDITSAWSTLAVFIIGAWAGRAGQPDAVVAALVMSGITGAGVNAAGSHVFLPFHPERPLYI